MTFETCAVSVESMLVNTPGVAKDAVNYANQSTTVEYDPNVITPAGMQQVLQSIGSGSVLAGPVGLEAGPSRQNQ